MMIQSVQGSAHAVDVFGMGHCCLDYLYELDPYPEKGKKGEVVNSKTVGGGPVPTALLTLQKFGCSTRFFGRVGDDADGKLVLSNLVNGGVDITPTIVDPNSKTPRAIIWIDTRNGDRTVALDKTGHKWVDASDFTSEWLENCSVFLSDGRATEANIEALRIAKEKDIPTVLDIGNMRKRLDEMLFLTDYAIVSSDLSSSFSGVSSPHDLAKTLLSKGVKTAIVTVGAEGAVITTGEKNFQVPGYPVDVVDTTGAGDVFHGAFIYGILNNFDLINSVRFANVSAALSCRHLSGMGGIPTLKQVKNILNIVS